jgi:hypothetical protein
MFGFGGRFDGERRFEASRPVSVRLSVRVRVPCPKAAPIGTKIVKRRTPERVPMQTRCRLAG